MKLLSPKKNLKEVYFSASPEGAFAKAQPQLQAYELKFSLCEQQDPLTIDILFKIAAQLPEHDI